MKTFLLQPLSNKIWNSHDPALPIFLRNRDTTIVFLMIELNNNDLKATLETPCSSLSHGGALLF